jgi:Flp pilus assembly protein TadG
MRRVGEGNRRLTALRFGSSRVSAIGGDPAGRLKRLRCERGQAVVEFAAVLPLLAAIVFVLIDFGKALYYYIDLTHVSNEGARIAAVSAASLPGGASSLSSYLCGQLGSSSSELRKGSASVDKAKVTISYAGGSGATGDPVTVKLVTKYHWIPFTGLAAMDVAGSATMRIENPASATGTTVITAGTTTCS